LLFTFWLKISIFLQLLKIWAALRPYFKDFCFQFLALLLSVFLLFAFSIFSFRSFGLSKPQSENCKCKSVLKSGSKNKVQNIISPTVKCFSVFKCDFCKEKYKVQLNSAAQEEIYQ